MWFLQVLKNDKKPYEIEKFINLQPQLSHGVTGNTSDFGSEESRFEP